MKTLTFKLAMVSAVLLMLAGMFVSCKEKEKTTVTRINGTWNVKTLNIEGVMTDIGPLPDSAHYPNISITIPDALQGQIEGNTFSNPILIDFEIKEHQQIRIGNYVEYVENELLIQFEQGVDAANFAAGCVHKIVPKRLLSKRLNIWLFETDGTEKLSVIISDLSQDANIKYIQYNHAGIELREEATSFKENIHNTMMFEISNNELRFIDSQNNPVIVFIKQSNKN
jgi:hypothetical protein